MARGTLRALAALGYVGLVEFPLGNGRRADILALGGAGEFVIVEIKTSLADFRADRKWPCYLDFADRFYFAVPTGFPTVLIPEQCGLMVADGFGAEILRAGRANPLPAARRRAVMLRFARVAAARLTRLLDPDGGAASG
ncbi:MAG TPA: MmcB family DNA repair protein [Stellaceae bacterium]|nr:MmcB family DNA repair protein [Stellaceae bacterium]